MEMVFHILMFVLLLWLIVVGTFAMIYSLCIFWVEIEAYWVRKRDKSQSHE